MGPFHLREARSLPVAVGGLVVVCAGSESIGVIALIEKEALQCMTAIIEVTRLVYTKYK